MRVTVCSFIIVIGLFSCTKEVNNLNLFMEKNGVIYLTYKTLCKDALIEKGNYSENGELFISTVYDNKLSKTKNISQVIDFSTFDMLQNFEEYRKNILPYYCKDYNYEFCYFKDNRYIYILDNKSANPIFFIAGSVKNHKLYDGNYISVDGILYSGGNKTENINPDNFRTIRFYKNKSEWEFNFGADGINLYINNILLTWEHFQRFDILDESLRDSLVKKYFTDSNLEKINR